MVRKTGLSHAQKAKKQRETMRNRRAKAAKHRPESEEPTTSQQPSLTVNATQKPLSKASKPQLAQAVLTLQSQLETLQQSLTQIREGQSLSNAKLDLLLSRPAVVQGVPAVQEGLGHLNDLSSNSELYSALVQSLELQNKN